MTPGGTINLGFEIHIQKDAFMRVYVIQPSAKQSHLYITFSRKMRVQYPIASGWSKIILFNFYVT